MVERLDFLLELIKNNGRIKADMIYRYLEKSGFAGKDISDRCLDYLVRHQYTTNDNGHYKLTVEGEILFETGKFRQKFKDINDLKQWSEDSAKFSKWAVWIALMTLMATCVFEIIHTLGNSHTCNTNTDNKTEQTQHFIERPRQ